MCFMVVVVVFAVVGISSTKVPSLKALKEDTLVLSNIIFRHGDRTPDINSLWPSNPFYDERFYEPYGYGQLTYKGTRTEYKIGLALRKRYSKFLGQTWNMSTLEARSTNMNRTKMSLGLVLTGLYSPDKQLSRWKWKGFHWQPSEDNYYKFDKELLGAFSCSKYRALLKELYASPKFKDINTNYQWVYDIFFNNTGVFISSAREAFRYYFGFLVQEQLGFPAEKWSKSIYPEPMRTLTIDYYYYAMTNTTALRRVATGYLLKKIIQDAKAKIDGSLIPSGRKLFLYSGHEYNVANALSGLDLFDGQIPNYGSYVLFELHRVKETYGIQILYQNYETTEPKLLTLPGCRSFCPFDHFVSLTRELIPEDKDLEWCDEKLRTVASGSLLEHRRIRLSHTVTNSENNLLSSPGKSFTAEMENDIEEHLKDYLSKMGKRKSKQ